MIGLLGAIGGAAAVELSKLRRGRGKGEEMVAKLKEREKHLASLVEVRNHPGSMSGKLV